MDHFSIPTYLDRIAYSDSLEPNLSTLQSLQRQHLYHIPFENLDIHWGHRIKLDPEQIYDKVILRKRGGFCYELNGMFYELLTRLGFSVKRVNAMVMGDEGSWSADYAHMTLIVNLGGNDYLVEVGFGRFSSQALRFEPGLAQQNQLGLFKIEPFLEDRWVVLHWDGEDWKPEFAFTDQACRYADFQNQCNYHQDHPDSHFRKKKLITKLTPSGRITLTSHELKIHEGDQLSEWTIEDEGDFNTKLKEHFDIEAG
jgi:N-hydroxyarylamine O-acetyltransferase